MEALIFEKNDLAKAARWLLEKAGGHRKIALEGEMGAGKTTLVGAVCRELGVETPTASPTFSLINQYSFLKKDGARGLVHHLDLYRLRSLDEALDIGIGEVLEDENWAFIEWPALAGPVLPEDFLKIRLEPTGETERRLTIIN